MPIMAVTRDCAVVDSNPRHQEEPRQLIPRAVAMPIGNVSEWRTAKRAVKYNVCMAGLYGRGMGRMEKAITVNPFFQKCNDWGNEEDGHATGILFLYISGLSSFAPSTLDIPDDWVLLVLFGVTSEVPGGLESPQDADRLALTLITARSRLVSIVCPSHELG